MTIPVELMIAYVFAYAGLANTGAVGVIPDWMQYGSFGLCCVLVIYLMYQLDKMGKVIGKKDDKFIELMKEDIESRNRLSQALEDRPCLAHDQRVSP